MLEEDVTIVLRGDEMVSITTTRQRSSFFVSEKKLQYKKEGVNNRNKGIHMRSVQQRTQHKIIFGPNSLGTYRFFLAKSALEDERSHQADVKE
jgi:protease II